MAKVLIIGAGGVGNVAVHKCAQAADVFEEITLASRTVAKCEKIAADVLARTGVKVNVASVDADDAEQVAKLIRQVKPTIVLNVALPYQDLPIMDACLAEKVDYVDTANYEPRDVAKFEYSWQWAYQERFKAAGITALLGSGFDPGVTNMFCAHAQKHLFDEIHSVDIIDCNAGDHGHPFATNFNPEINIREITQPGRYWENGEWIEIPAMSISETFDFPGVGDRKAYLLYHEELESLVQNIKGLKRIRFWMTFGQAYLTHLEVLQNIGMTGIEAIDFQGQKIIPIEFLKALLPDPGSLAANYTGKTSIGCIIEGVKDGKPKKILIYNICDHAETNLEVGAQAVSYTTGVPAMLGTLMVATGAWRGPGVLNMEQNDPDPFLEKLGGFALPWAIKDL